MAVRVASARAIGQNMKGHGSHDNAGQSSLKQTRVEQSKEEQHRAYITILHIDRPSPALVLPCSAMPCRTLIPRTLPYPSLPCPALPCRSFPVLRCAALYCFAALLTLPCLYRVY